MHGPRVDANKIRIPPAEDLLFAFESIERGAWLYEETSGEWWLSPAAQTLLQHSDSAATDPRAKDQMTQASSPFSRAGLQQANQITEAFSELLSKGTPFSIESRSARPHEAGAANRERWIRITGRRWDRGGSAMGACGTIEDVDDQKATSAESERLLNGLRMATEAGRVGIWDWDVPSNVLLWDQSMYDLYSLNPGDFAEAFAAWKRTVHPEDAERAGQEVLDALVPGGKPFSSQFRIVRPDGTVRTIRAKSRVYRDDNGNALRMIGTNWDITEETEREDLLRKARESALQAADSKSRFLANMSHEIRTPINGLVGLLDELREAPSEHERAEIIDTMRGCANGLLTIVNDILDVSKMDAGTLDLSAEPADLSAISRQVCEALLPRARSKRLSLRLEVVEPFPQRVLADRQRIAQIMLNLVANAVKFTDAGEVKIRQEVETNSEGQNLVVWSVKDTGVGIAPDQLGQLFLPFSQADDSRTRSHEGTGLGLYISKGLAERMGATLEAESTPGEGSLFRLKLPLKVAEPDPVSLSASPSLFRTVEETGASPDSTTRAPDTTEAEAQLLKRLRVLVAEDNLINQRVIGNMLRRLGVKFWIMQDGAQTVRAVLEGKGDQGDPPEGVNLVLMDVFMPEMDGLEATRQIRRASPNLPIVALSASVLLEEREHCLAAGMNAFLAKPLDRDELKAELLRRACGLSERTVVAENHDSLPSAG